jgi:hypothetical protein
MATLTMKVDWHRLDGCCKDAFKRMVFSTAEAITDTLKDVRAAERSALQSWVHVRVPSTTSKFARIIQYPKVKEGRMQGTIALWPGDEANLAQEGSSRGGHWFMPWLEQGFIKTMPPHVLGYNMNPAEMWLKAHGVLPVAITGTARPSATEIITPELRLKALALKRTRGWQEQRSHAGKPRGQRTHDRRGALRKIQTLGPWRGQYGTWMGKKGIYQRTGSGREDFRPLYLFRRSAMVPRKLTFEALGERVVNAVFERRLTEQVADVLARSFGKAIG